MRQNPFVPALAALLLAAARAVLAQQGPDDLWETTMRMEGDGMKMPPMTQQVCAPKGKPESRMEMDKDSNCKMVESKQSGNKFTFKMVCTEGGDSYTGTGEMEDLSKDAYRGSFTSSGVREGRKFTMRMDMSGKRVGNCDAAAIERKAAAEIAAIEKQQRDAMVKVCNDAVANLATSLVFAPEGRSEAMPCRDRQADFCANAGSVLKALRDRASWDAAQQKYSEGFRKPPGPASWTWPLRARRCARPPWTSGNGAGCAATARKRSRCAISTARAAPIPAWNPGIPTCAPSWEGCPTRPRRQTPPRPRRATCPPPRSRPPRVPPPARPRIRRKSLPPPTSSRKAPRSSRSS
jgi:hypothetical protein